MRQYAQLSAYAIDIIQKFQCMIQHADALKCTI